MIAGKFNKTDEPIKDISMLANEINWKTYKHKDIFKYLCTIKADKKEEKFIITDEKKEDMNRSCVYIMVVKGKIFKIGSALRGMRNRISSYNTGKVKYRTKGTNSVTNYWVLQSFIKLGVEITVYATFPKVKGSKILGEKVEEPFPSAKTWEGVIIKLFLNEYKKKPFGITQK